MKLRTLVISIVLLIALFLPATAAYSADLTSKDIEKDLMCQCGCTMVVDVCQCENANQIRARIAGLIDQGQDKDQILAAFVSQYGEEMLSSPPKTGFNLIAWIGPFAAVVAGSTALFFILRAWAVRGKSPKTSGESPPVEPASTTGTDGYLDRLEAELKQFREEDTE